MSQAVAESMLGPNLGRRVHELRVDRGLSCTELGERLGIGATAIHNIEARGVLRVSTLEQLAWALGVDLVVELRAR